MRHAAVRVRDGELDIFFSRGEDCPEHILHTRLALTDNWLGWHPAAIESLLLPEREWEGADLPLVPSRFGAIHGPARQLRDPALFEDEGRWYLVYSVAGESGLGIAELHED
jgi:hypothetical protein